MKYWLHFALSSIFMALAAGLCTLLVLSYTSSRVTCGSDSCEVWEKAGMLNASHRTWRSVRPVSLAVYQTAQETPSLHIVSVHGDSMRLTSLNETADGVQKIQAALGELPAGTDYEVAAPVVSWEWYLLAVLVLASAGLNFIGSLRSLLRR